MKTVPQSLKKYFSEKDLNLIAQEIGKQEHHTSGEIRVAIHTKRKWNERKLAIHDLALKEFYRLGMQNTRDRSGVLLFFLFTEHQFYVLADEGIHLKGGDLWNSVADAIAQDFKEGKYCNGICKAVQMIGSLLQQHYPIKPNDTNELSNDVEIN